MTDCLICSHIQARKYAHVLNDMVGWNAEEGSGIPGHVVVTTTAHVKDIYVSPPLIGKLFSYAVHLARQLGYKDVTILSGMGFASGTYPEHMMVQIIPRVPNDQMLMPPFPPRTPEPEEVQEKEVEETQDAGDQDDGVPEKTPAPAKPAADSSARRRSGSQVQKADRRPRS